MRRLWLVMAGILLLVGCDSSQPSVTVEESGETVAVDISSPDQTYASMMNLMMFGLVDEIDRVTTPYGKHELSELWEGAKDPSLELTRTANLWIRCGSLHWVDATEYSATGVIYPINPDAIGANVFFFTLEPDGWRLDGFVPAG